MRYITTITVATLVLTSIGCDSYDQDFAGQGQEGADDRIVGGRDTDITEVPWQVSIGGCGGSIIDDVWILTAAHCVVGNTDQRSVEAGVSKLTEEGQVRSVVSVYVHPGFTQVEDGKDVALLRLSEPLELNGSSVAAIELAGVDDAPPGTIALVSGWGRLSSGGGSPEILQSVEVPIVSNEDAAVVYPNVTDDQLAAGIMDVGGADSCQGDSGGPLVVGFPGSPRLAGVVSYGAGCGEPNAPGMYARVSSFLGWIDETMNADGGGDDGGGDDGGGDDGGGACGVFSVETEGFTGDVEAQSECPGICADAGGTFTGQWWSIPGQWRSVCQCENSCE